MGDALSGTAADRRGRVRSGSPGAGGAASEDWWLRIADESFEASRLRDWVAECRAGGYSELRLRGVPDEGPWKLWARTPDGHEYPYGRIDSSAPAFFAAWPQPLWDWAPPHGLVVGYLTQADRTQTLGPIDGFRLHPMRCPRQPWVVELFDGRGQAALNVTALHLTRIKKPGAREEAIIEVGVALLYYLRVYPKATDEELSAVAMTASAPWRATPRVPKASAAPSAAAGNSAP